MAAKYTKGTVKPAEDFDCENACVTLKQAMKGLGTDEKKIIQVLVDHDNDQRQKIKLQYTTMYGKDLEDDLKCELGGYFENVCISLLVPNIDYLAKCLRVAMVDFGTDEDVLVDIICTSNNEKISAVKEAYKNIYKSDLEEDIESETSGDFRKILKSLLQANRDESQEVDDDLVAEEAKALLDAGERRFGTDESEFNRILASKSYEFLEKVFQKYYEISGEKDIESSIISETSGDLQAAYLAIVQSIRDTPSYFAKRIRRCLSGPGTNDKLLIQHIVSRAEFDMCEIREAYQSLFDVPLSKAIEDDCSGDYMKILVRLVSEAEKQPEENGIATFTKGAVSEAEKQPEENGIASSTKGANADEDGEADV